ncbi:MAG: right-handed parallel beta-helix repeat-containing protein [Kiritimatiellales bacterium]
MIIMRSLIIGLISIIGSSHATQTDFTCTLITGVPEIVRDVSYFNQDDNVGMRCFWIDGDGRRDIGQQFSIDTPVALRSLALRIRSAASSSLYERPFRLTFARQISGKILPGEIIAEYNGLIPAKGQVPSSGKWLVLDFPALSLERGEYCFLLQYAESGANGQAVVLTAGSVGAYKNGKGFQAATPGAWAEGRPVNFILSSDSVFSDEPRILKVDRRGGTPYATVAAAAAAVEPGDTLFLVPGSGPYREPLFIRTSGTAEKPVIIEGNNELVTGFDLLTGFRAENGVMVCDLPVEFPCVLAYQGERLRQSAETGQFTKYAVLSADQKRIGLLPGVETNGWEVSARRFAVQILNVSHHVYRNLKASGSQNDGFNLHGTGDNVLFENIEGFQNLDEGFSAHDNYQCEIRNGAFFDNDNGIANMDSNVVMKAENITIYDNLGNGLWLRSGVGDLKQVKVWNNGITQIYFDTDATVQVTDCLLIEPAWSNRVWISYMETRNDTAVMPLRIKSTATVNGGSVQVHSAP